MKMTLKDIIRFIVISPEVLISLIILLLHSIWPNLFCKIGNILLGADWGSAWLLIGLPLGGLVFGYGVSQNILNPDDSSELYTWEKYAYLRNRVLYSLFLCVSALAVNVLLYLISKSLSIDTAGLVYVLAQAAWFTALCTLGIAALVSKTILKSKGQL